MSIHEIYIAAGTALDLILAFPGRWMLFIVVFVVVVEAMMFIPYVGFTLKMIVGSLIGAQGFVLFRDAAVGVPPDLSGIFDAFGLPLLAQASIVLGGIIPLIIGILYLQLTVGWPATKFFFGNIMKAKPPEASRFERFKYIMQLGAIPFTFVAPIVIIGGIHDLTAVTRGVLLGLNHWPVLLLLLVTSLLAEWGNARITSDLPKKYAIPLLGFSIVAFIVWTFAFSFTLYTAIAVVPQ
jgi:hypothetical protein